MTRRTSRIIPSRGEVWLGNLDPAIGEEMEKSRPLLVLSPSGLSSLRLRIICPVTSWKPHFEHNPWLIRVQPDDANHLDRISAIDAFQVRCISLNRLTKKIGELDEETVATVAKAVAVCVGFQIKM